MSQMSYLLEKGGMGWSGDRNFEGALMGHFSDAALQKCPINVPPGSRGLYILMGP